MQNRQPTAPNAGAPIPAFEPVPRKCARHDGWTPARQRAFIEALADTGSVTRAAAMVNMATEGAYYLRRQPGAEGFRAAWEAALDYGVARMKDIAFERAVTGYLVPVITGGKLLGYRRIYNDRLLMFCLRHYGQDANGKRTKIEYFSTRASAVAGALPSPSGEGPGVGESGTQSQAEASTTTVRTVITGGSASDHPTLDETSTLIDSFDPAALDDTARAAIAGILADCAARRREDYGTIDDPVEVFTPVLLPRPTPEDWEPMAGNPNLPPPTRADGVSPDEFLEHDPRALTDESDQYRASADEMPWTILDSDDEMERIEEAVASVKRARLPAPSGEGSGGGDSLPQSVRTEPVEVRAPTPSKPKRKKK